MTWISFSGKAFAITGTAARAVSPAPSIAMIDEPLRASKRQATAAAACLIDSLLSVAPNIKSGYSFDAAGTLLQGTVYNGFEVNAAPTAVNTTGVRSFCDDQTGVIKFKVNTGTGAGTQIGLAAGSCIGVGTAAGTSGPVGN